MVWRAKEAMQEDFNKNKILLIDSRVLKNLPCILK